MLANALLPPSIDGSSSVYASVYAPVYASVYTSVYSVQWPAAERRPRPPMMTPRMMPVPSNRTSSPSHLSSLNGLAS